MTSDGVMRHPSFEGMRTDKKANTGYNGKSNNRTANSNCKKTVYD